VSRSRTLPPTEDRRTTDSDGHDCIDPLGVAIVTVSSSRGDTGEDGPSDPSGDAIKSILEEAGHVVTYRQAVPDDYVRVKTTVGQYVDQPDVDIVVTTGGTGVTVDGITPDAVGELFERERRSARYDRTYIERSPAFSWPRNPTYGTPTNER